MSLDVTAKGSIDYAQRNLFIRFFATITVCFIVIMLGVGVILFHQLDNEQKKLLNSIAAEYQRILTAHGGKKLTEIAVNNPQQLIELNIAMFKADQSQQWLTGNNLEVSQRKLSDFYWFDHAWYNIVNSPTYLSLLLTGDQEFWLILDFNTQLNQKYQQLRWIAAVLATLCIIIAIVVWRLIGSTLFPLQQLAQVVDKTSGWSIDSFDRTEVLPPTKTTKGLEVLHFSINHLLRRLVTTIYSMENTVDAIAHDLKTPLARISLSAEKALSKQTPVNEESQYLQHALSDCAESAQQANHMLTTLMGIHDEESGKHSIETKKIELNNFVGEIASFYQELAEERNMVISTDELATCQLTTDPGRLTQVLVNLIDNSLKYSHNGGTIRLACGLIKKTQVFIQVTDQGIGIDEQYHQLIFKRLYRVDASRSNSGYGLGLAQVKTIINTLQGSIELDSSIGQGSCFRILLPICLQKHKTSLKAKC